MHEFEFEGTAGKFHAHPVSFITTIRSVYPYLPHNTNYSYSYVFREAFPRVSLENKNTHRKPAVSHKTL